MTETLTRGDVICTAVRQSDGTYRCSHGYRWDADFNPIEEEK